jgi:nucleoid-associated protein YgaU
MKKAIRAQTKGNQVIRNKGHLLFLLVGLIFGIGISPVLAQASTSDEYLEQSRRLAKLAEEAFSKADYDMAAILADEAAFLAIDAANVAAQQLEQRGNSGTKSSPPVAPPAALPNALPNVSPDAFPATYTVRPWAVSKDCFWNIAGFPWVYGDPHQWKLIYNANKSKLPDPNNPDSLEPGTVLGIPSIKGEVRQGAWESGKTYEALK